MVDAFARSVHGHMPTELRIDVMFIGQCTGASMVVVPVSNDNAHNTTRHLNVNVDGSGYLSKHMLH